MQQKNKDNNSNLETGCIAQVQQLRKEYGRLIAVDGISFELKRGEIFGLLGPNGAGKTTTISMLAGILPSTGGTILLDGNPSGRGLETRQILGVVPQELALYARLTARENLAFFGELYGLKGISLQARIVEMLQLVGLSDRADDRADTYSGGMKRRLNLAIGLMHRPQLLLLDEPTVGVDPQSRNHIFEGVRSLNRAGLTILYTSHYMEEVQALCDRVGIMDHGKLIACGPVNELIASYGTALIELGVEDPATGQAFLPRIRSLEHVESADIETDAPTNLNTPNAFSVPNAQRPTPNTLNTTHLTIRTRRPNLLLPALVTTLNATNTPLLSLNVRQPSLESVFLALTGKSLRD